MADEPTEKQFPVLQLFILPCLCGAVAVIPLLTYLMPIIRFAPEQLPPFLVASAVATSPLTAGLFLAFLGARRKILLYLEARKTPPVPDKIFQDCLHTAVTYPQTVFIIGVLSWSIGATAVAFIWGQISDTSLVTRVSISLGGSAVGFLAQGFSYIMLRNLLAPLRNLAASEFSDPTSRAAYVGSTSFERKLTIVMGGLIITALTFGVMLMHARATYVVGNIATEMQGELLDKISTRIDAGEELNAILDEIAMWVSEQTVVFQVIPAAVLELEGAHPPLARMEMVQIRNNPAAGDTHEWDLPHSFAWRQLPNGDVLLAMSPFVERATSVKGRMGWGILGLIIFSTVASIIIARFAARDLSDSANLLGKELTQISEGNLASRDVVLESEDEFGALARTVEALRATLRTTVGRMSSAADRMDATVSQVSEMSDTLVSVSTEQVSRSEQVHESMTSINSDAEDVSASSRELKASVDASASTITQIGAVGGELSERSSLLSEKMSETSSFIQEMIASVNQINHSSDELSSAAENAAGEMEKMDDAVRNVDQHARESAELSNRVVRSAEQGRTRVQETMHGMDKIRSSSETATKVILQLGERTEEIGNIVNVIDNVADETNLLALNAAIIAAQAGDHGRAFSVVADEIKDLADRVLASTKEISQVIGDLQGEGEKAVSAMRDGSENVQSGVELSRLAGESLEEITEAANESGTRVSGIAELVQKQIETTRHVVDLMTRVRTGVELINRAGDEQSKGSSFILESSHTVQEMVGVVDRTTGEQADGARQIAATMEQIRDAMARVDGLLTEQSEACNTVTSSVQEMQEQARGNRSAANHMKLAMDGLQEQAEKLREEVRRFRI